MPPHFGWVDFSEDDRRQMLEVVRLFREQEPLDELGVGMIRDAFYFIFRTDTVQTWAR